ncbi:MAG TPA: Ig-like domain-containing protein [Thermoplasmata archaeon]|nr:Ig-like domain-containing protein [Thermoplasmata archaeon]
MSGSAVLIAVVLLLVVPLPGWAAGTPTPPKAAFPATPTPAPATIAPAIKGAPLPDGLLPLPAGVGLALPAMGHPLHPLPARPVPNRAAMRQAAAREIPSVASLLGAGHRLLPAPSAGANVVVNGSQVWLVSANLTIGSLTVVQNGIVLIENAGRPVTLQVNGNVVLADRGALLLNFSATLRVNESYDNEWAFEAINTTTFFAVGANLTANGHQWIGLILGNANVTVLLSNFCYPNSWFPIDVGGTANLTVANSFFLSDVVMYDTPAYPSRAQVRFNNSLGMNLWTVFRSGQIANLSFPAPFGYENWSFPGAYAVTGVNYSLTIGNSYVGVHALYLLAGSQVTVVNTTQIAVAFGPLSEALSFVGLRQQRYGSLLVDPTDFYLQLYNVSVLTWNFYPDQGASLVFSNCQVGEIIAAGHSSVVVVNSNLTGDGGYYSAIANASLTIYNSKIYDELIATGSGLVRLVNSSDNPSTSRFLTASGTAAIVTDDVSLGMLVGYSVQFGGTIYIENNLSVSVTDSGQPAAGALVDIRWTPNGTLAGSSLSGPTGLLTFPLIHRIIRATGGLIEDSYEVTATSGWLAAESAVTIAGRANLLFGLLPLIASTSPASGSTSAAVAGPFSFEFSFPMDRARTDAALTASPAFASTESWSAINSSLSVVPVAPLAPGTNYTLTLDASASTAQGLALPAQFVLAFETAPRVPAPRVLSANPTNGSTGVAPSANLSIDFSVAMDESSTALAFSVSPAVPGAVLTVSGASLTWSHATPFAYNTLYTFIVNGSAKSAAGAALGAPFVIEIRTQAAPTTASGGGNGGTNPSPWLIAGALAAAAVALLLLALLVRARRRPPYPTIVADYRALPPPSPPAPPPPPPPTWQE